MEVNEPKEREKWTANRNYGLCFCNRRVYEEYCEAMKELSSVIMELLGISLGVDGLHYQRFFEDGVSIMRCNYYPPCNSANHTFGTGPHTDPTSLTILHQDQVGGLEVFVDNKWHAVRPRAEAFVVNIGDTFMVRMQTMLFSFSLFPS